MTKSKTLPFLLFTLVLVSCGHNESFSVTTNYENLTDTPLTPLPLSNYMFEEVGKENVTFLEHINYKNASEQHEYDLMTKFSSGCYLGSIIDNKDDRNIQSEISYYNKNGKVAYTSHPDKYNKVKEYTSTLKWKDSVYINTLSYLSKDLFEYVSRDESGTSTYSMSALAITSASTKEVVDRIYNSATNYIHRGTDSKFGSDSLVKMDLYVKESGITGFALKYSKIENSVRCYTELSVDIVDVGTTNLTKEDVCPAPYSYDAKYKTQYTSLKNALSEMQNKNYEFTVEVRREKNVFQRSKGFLFDEGYSGYDELVTSSGSSFHYYGIHKRTDGKYEHYTGSNVNSLKGAGYQTSPHQGLMNFDFTSEIFEYDASVSSNDYSVFHLRSDFKNNNYVSDVTSDMSYDEYTEYANDLTIGVENGHLISFSFTFVDNLGNNYSFLEDISNHGTCSAVPSDLANFSTYTEYVSPTSFKEVDVAIYNLSTGSISSYSDCETVIKSSLYDTSALSLLPFPLVSDAAYYFDSAAYIPASIIPAALYFFFDNGTDDIATAYRKIKTSINSAGYSLVDADEKSCSQTINSKYEITLDYSSGVIALTYTSPVSYES